MLLIEFMAGMVHAQWLGHEIDKTQWRSNQGAVRYRHNYGFSDPGAGFLQGIGAWIATSDILFLND